MSVYVLCHWFCNLRLPWVSTNPENMDICVSYFIGVLLLLGQKLPKSSFDQIGKMYF